MAAYITRNIEAFGRRLDQFNDANCALGPFQSIYDGLWAVDPKATGPSLRAASATLRDRAASCDARLLRLGQKWERHMYSPAWLSTHGIAMELAETEFQLCTNLARLIDSIATR